MQQHRAAGRLAVWVALACLLLTQATSPVEAAGKLTRPSSTKVEGEIKANEWVKIESHGAGRRYDGVLFWLPAERSYVLAMGALGAWNDHCPFCYDQQTFDLGSRVWKNRFPEGKPWKPAIGPSDAPTVPYMCLKDGRLGLTEAGFIAYFQYAFDTDRNRLLLEQSDVRPATKADPRGGHQRCGLRLASRSQGRPGCGTGLAPRLVPCCAGRRQAMTGELQ